jgi:hypothetical protein
MRSGTTRTTAPASSANRKRERNTSLACSRALCYSSVPRSEQLNNNKRRGKRSKKEVDEDRETMHNLTSLLLTNKTIRKRSKAVPNTKFFNN